MPFITAARNFLLDQEGIRASDRTEKGIIKGELTVKKIRISISMQ